MVESPWLSKTVTLVWLKWMRRRLFQEGVINLPPVNIRHVLYVTKWMKHKYLANWPSYLWPCDNSSWVRTQLGQRARSRLLRVLSLCQPGRLLPHVHLLRLRVRHQQQEVLPLQSPIHPESSAGQVWPLFHRARRVLLRKPQSRGRRGVRRRITRLWRHRSGLVATQLLVMQVQYQPDSVHSSFKVKRNQNI